MAGLDFKTDSIQRPAGCHFLVLTCRLTCRLLQVGQGRGLLMGGVIDSDRIKLDGPGDFLRLDFDGVRSVHDCRSDVQVAEDALEQGQRCL